MASANLSLLVTGLTFLVFRHVDAVAWMHERAGFGAALVVFLPLFMMVTKLRTRDIGWSPSTTWLALVPGLALAWLLAPGLPQTDREGHPVTRKGSWAQFLAMFAGLVIMFLWTTGLWEQRNDFGDLTDMSVLRVYP